MINALFYAASAYRYFLFALIILFLVIDSPFALLMVSLGTADVTVYYISFLRCYFLVTASLGIERSSLLFLFILIDRIALLLLEAAVEFFIFFLF